MELNEYRKMYELEESHWWFLSKRKLIFSFFEKYYDKYDVNRKILDVGCGTGIILKNLEKYGKAVGIDTSSEAIKFSRLRKVKDVRMYSAENMPFKRKSFDVVCCFDVLYHKNIKDDENALRDIARVTKKGGRLFLIDSAFKFMFSKHDMDYHARTRYDLKEIKAKVEAAGFRIEKLTYYNFFLFPVVYIARKFIKKSDIKKRNFIVNSILCFIMSIERKMLKYINFPFGVSVFCIARMAK